LHSDLQMLKSAGTCFLIVSLKWWRSCRNEIGGLRASFFWAWGSIVHIARSPSRHIASVAIRPRGLALSWSANSCTRAVGPSVKSTHITKPQLTKCQIDTPDRITDRTVRTYTCARARPVVSCTRFCGRLTSWELMRYDNLRYSRYRFRFSFGSFPRGNSPGTRIAG